MHERRKVAVAMSGGVDSSVAAALLKEQGHDVIGVTFRLFGCDIARGAAESSACCSQEDVADAMRVSLALGIPHEVVDFSEAFAARVIGPFVADYVRGRTPNPCILCNGHIKFGSFLHCARERGWDAVATGHHAAIVHQDGRWQLRKGADAHKDQSYFLFPLHQETLPRVLFPVGEHTKPRVRELAARYGLPEAQKSESQEICFAAGGDYADFLERHAGVTPEPGPIVLLDGSEVGRHEGLHRYTVGQRRGLGVAAPNPLYVVAKEVAGRRLVVGPKEALACGALVARGAVWTAGARPRPGDRLDARIRYRSAPTPAEVTAVDPDGFAIRFEQPVNGVAPGQAAVLYQGDEVVAGAWIDRTEGAPP